MQNLVVTPEFWTDSVVDALTAEQRLDLLRGLTFGGPTAVGYQRRIYGLAYGLGEAVIRDLFAREIVRIQEILTEDDIPF